MTPGCSGIGLPGLGRFRSPGPGVQRRKVIKVQPRRTFVAGLMIIPERTGDSTQIRQSESGGVRKRLVGASRGGLAASQEEERIEMLPSIAIRPNTWDTAIARPYLCGVRPCAPTNLLRAHPACAATEYGSQRTQHRSSRALPASFFLVRCCLFPPLCSSSFFLAISV